MRIELTQDIFGRHSLLISWGSSALLRLPTLLSWNLCATCVYCSEDEARALAAFTSCQSGVRVQGRHQGFRVCSCS